MGTRASQPTGSLRTTDGHGASKSTPAESATRDALLDATEHLMREEGYGAVTARKVAKRAGLNNHQIIYYYFSNHEDLLCNVFRRRAEDITRTLQEISQSENPLALLWDYYRDPEGNWFSMEFMALANHMESIRAEIARYGVEFRRLETECISRQFADKPLPGGASPAVLSLAMASVARVMGRQARLGLSGGHDEVADFVAAWLATLPEASAP